MDHLGKLSKVLCLADMFRSFVSGGGYYIDTEKSNPSTLYISIRSEYFWLYHDIVIMVAKNQ